MAEKKPREGSVLAVVPDEAGNALVFSVRGAAPEGGSKTITLRLADMHPNNVAYAALHGMNQRIRDMGALGRDSKTGLPASPADIFAAIERGVNHYASGVGEWNLKSAVPRTDGNVALLVRALSELYPARAVDELTAWVKAKSAPDRARIAISAQVKPIMDRLEAAMIGEVDEEALFEGL